MITLALYLVVVIGALVVPVMACARYLEWHSWDADRRIERLRDRGLA